MQSTRPDSPRDRQADARPGQDDRSGQHGLRSGQKGGPRQRSRPARARPGQPRRSSRRDGSAAPQTEPGPPGQGRGRPVRQGPVPFPDTGPTAPPWDHSPARSDPGRGRTSRPGIKTQCLRRGPRAGRRSCPGAWPDQRAVPAASSRIPGSGWHPAPAGACRSPGPDPPRRPLRPAPASAAASSWCSCSRPRPATPPDAPRPAWRGCPC